MSREAKVGKITSEKERLQYDQKDGSRIRAVMVELTDTTVKLMNAISEYQKELYAKVDEDTASRMRYTRQDIIEKYEELQVALNRLGYVFRIGDEAFDKMIEFLANPETVTLDMSGM
jgi:hypothetical protein